MPEHRAARRVLRWSEALYAVVALLVALGLPMPPHGREWVALAFWYGTAALAAVLAWRLSAWTSTTRIIALVLGVLVIGSAIATVPAELAMLRQPHGAFVWGPFAIVWLSWAAQVVALAAIGAASRTRGAGAAQQP